MAPCRGRVYLVCSLASLLLVWNQSLIQAEENSYSLFLKGLAAIEEKNLPAAEQYLKEAAKIDPKSSQVWCGLGKVYLQKERLKEAVAAYRKAAVLDPQNKEPYYGLGIAYLRLKRYPLARFQYEKLIKLYPEEKEAYLVLADLYTGAGLTRQALKTYEKLTRLFPDNAVVFYNLGVLFVQKKEYRSAKRVIDRSITLSPNFLPARNLLGRVYQETGDLTAAEAAFQEVLALSPDDPVARTSLARIYFEKERWQEAAETLEKISESKNPELLRLLGFAYHKNRDYEKALASFRKSLILKDEATTRFYLAITLDSLKRDTEAIEELRKVVAQEPDNHVALNYLGYTLVERNEDLSEAKRLIERAVQMEPENGAYLDSLGWLYFKVGNLRFARYYLLKAARYEKDPEIFQHLSELYRCLGDAKKEAYYRKKSQSLREKEDKNREGLK